MDKNSHGSPAFPQASAHAVHKGRAGKNQIDPVAFVAIGRALLDKVEKGETKVVLTETHEIAEAGKKRRARTVTEVELPD